TGSDAVNAALLFQTTLAAEKWEKEPLEVRIGLHIGEVQEIGQSQKADTESKVVGLPMDLASRLMGLAVGRQILMTRTIFDDARQYVREVPGLNGTAASADSAPALKWMAHGAYLFKGNPEPMEIFEVGAEGVSPLRAPPDSEKARRSVSLSDEETLGWRPAAGLEVPRRPGWVLERKLGEGGFGEVWLGRHGRTKERRVFKFCFDSDRLRSFKRELTLFRVLRDVLGNRSDIARLYEVQLDASPYFLETEFSEKGDLGDYIKSIGGPDKLSLEERLEIVERTAEAVAAAHSVGILHKDIKPSNVLMYLAEDGKVRPRLADFGIGLLTDRSVIEGKNITVTGLTEEMLVENQSSRTGTRMYAPPESLTGAPFTMQGDVYSLGVLLYQMAAGDLHKPLAPGWERDISDPLLREDIASCVSGDLRLRLRSARQVADRLLSLADRRAALRRRRLLRLSAAAIVILVGSVVAVGGWAIHEMSLRQRAEHAEKEAQQQRDRAQSFLNLDRQLTS
ncbi:MAG TPA: protein kinase, partial [Phycisphaerales bacterium]|nr:protein kinase [Phycisphaerales bacterium]